MQGIPLIASSPVRHESPLGLNPVEVHAFAPPWKALAEFALHNDLERIDPSTPHFQQLINQVSAPLFQRLDLSLSLVKYVLK